MKVTNIVGSPRLKGNSAAIARKLVELLSKGGAKIKTFELNTLTYRGCQGCMACKTDSEKCIIRDELQQVLEDIRTSDVTMLSSPVYVGDVNSQTKGLIDRFYSYYKNDFRANPKPSRLIEGKKLVFILSQGSPDEAMFNDIVPRYSRMFGRLGFSTILPIRAVGVGPGSDTLGNEALLKTISDVAGKLLAS